MDKLSVIHPIFTRKDYQQGITLSHFINLIVDGNNISLEYDAKEKELAESDRAKLLAKWKDVI